MGGYYGSGETVSEVMMSSLPWLWQLLVERERSAFISLLFFLFFIFSKVGFWRERPESG